MIQMLTLRGRKKVFKCAGDIPQLPKSYRINTSYFMEQIVKYFSKDEDRNLGNQFGLIFKIEQKPIDEILFGSNWVITMQDVLT